MKLTKPKGPFIPKDHESKVEAGQEVAEKEEIKEPVKVEEKEEE